MQPALKSLAVKAALALAVTVGTSLPSHAGIPVIDGGNLTQNIVSALEGVTQTAKQIQQYTTQLQQYQRTNCRFSSTKTC